MSDSSLSQSADERELSEWMRAAQSGQQASYRLLLNRVQELLKPFVRNALARAGLMSSSACEDVIQEILLGIHSKRDTYDPSQYFLPWMYAIARYKVIDYMRFSKKQASSISVEESGILDTLEAPQMDSPERPMDIQEVLELLPKKQRLVLELVKVSGLSLQEAALKTGFSISDVKVTIHRAIKTVQKRIQEVKRHDG